jgi:phosphohistidine phosphatase
MVTAKPFIYACDGDVMVANQLSRGCKEEAPPMKTLYLLRHAKSSWDDPNLDDFHRPLNKRGRKAARAMADYFAHHGLRPAMVLCSPALRTRQTLDALAAQLDAVEITFDERIYEASLQTLLARIHELPDHAGQVLLVGHNPGLERLALTLAETGVGDLALARLHDKFPTGTLAMLTTQAEQWDAVRAGSCRLEAFVRPADLDEEA